MQVTAGLRETIDILKQRYGASTQSEALERFINEHEPETFEAGSKIADLKFAVAGESKKPRKPRNVDS